VKKLLMMTKINHELWRRRPLRRFVGRCLCLVTLMGSISAQAHTFIAPERSTTIKCEKDSVGVAAPQQAQQENGTESKRQKPLLFAVKTNLLFDVATAVNLEVEVPLGRRFSLAGEFVFPWWLLESKQIAMQGNLGTLEARYWLGRRVDKPSLAGWFLGVHGGWGRYDLEWKTTGSQGTLWYGGLSGGYAHTINRKGNLRMEYSLGVGYLHTAYTSYNPQQDYDDSWHLMRQKDAKRIFIGPTRAKVSLVWMINLNSKKKGGAQ
jgi:hypothetical protein